MTFEYKRTVAAALAETNSKFALAEALALDIPQRPQGGSTDNDRDVLSYLEDARQEIIDAGGEPRGVSSLREYRLTALWVMIKSSGDVSITFPWVPGTSFSAHNEARRAGMSYQDLAGLDKPTVHDVQEAAGKPGTTWGSGGTAAKYWDDQYKVEAARQIMSDPEVADQVFNDPRSKVDAMNAIHRIDQKLPPPVPSPTSGPTVLGIFNLIASAKDNLRQAFSATVQLDPGEGAKSDILSRLGDLDTVSEQFRKLLTGMGVDEAIQKIMEGI